MRNSEHKKGIEMIIIAVNRLRPVYDKALAAGDEEVYIWYIMKTLFLRELINVIKTT